MPMGVSRPIFIKSNAFVKILTTVYVLGPLSKVPFLLELQKIKCSFLYLCSAHNIIFISEVMINLLIYFWMPNYQAQLPKIYNIEINQNVRK